MTVKGKLRISVFYTRDEHSPVGSLDAFCPACDFEHSFNVDLEGHGKHSNDVWSFNGDYDKPTFRPSMGANMRQTEKHHPRCHSWLTDGKWEYLSDSTTQHGGPNC